MGTVAKTALKLGRRSIGTVQSLRPTTAIALALAFTIGGAGLADAATGGNFILGKLNHESSTASLADSKGTPLSLSAPSGKAPLKVNRKTLVSNLNAQYVGGLSAANLQVTGGEGFIPPNTDTAVTGTPEKIVGTGPLSAGSYYVTATALLFIATNDNYGICYIARGSDTGRPLADGGTSSVGEFIQASETLAVSVKGGDTLQEWCQTGGSNGSLVDDAGITAIRIASSSGRPPA